MSEKLNNGNLPTIQKLTSGVLERPEVDAFIALMNEEPPVAWVSEHPYIKRTIKVNGINVNTPYLYMPIARVEFLLKSIFKRYRIEITGQGSSFNGVYVTVRVHFLHPIYNEWDYHDGIGAIQLQTAKGKSPADLANINNGALSMAYPLAKTLAVKDACDHFGRLFGSDLNRTDYIEYPDPVYLVPLQKGHPKWDKAVEAFAKGAVTIEQIKAHYNLSPEDELIFIDDAMEITSKMKNDEK